MYTINRVPPDATYNSFLTLNNGACCGWLVVKDVPDHGTAVRPYNQVLSVADIYIYIPSNTGAKKRYTVFCLMAYRKDGHCSYCNNSCEIETVQKYCLVAA